jgi:hypothetical protein
VAERPSLAYATTVLQARELPTKEHILLFQQFAREDSHLGQISRSIMKRAHEKFHRIIQTLIQQEDMSTTDPVSAVQTMNSIRETMQAALDGGLGLSRRLVWFTPNAHTIKLWEANPETRDAAQQLLHVVSLLNE